MDKSIKDMFEFSKCVDYEQEFMSQLKEKLADALCKYCPSINGDIDKKCNSQCDGNYCEKALDAYLDGGNDDEFEKMLGITETTKDDRSWCRYGF